MSDVAEPWGHKVTVHVYMAGGIENAADVSDQVCDFLNEQDRAGKPYIDAEFVGVTIDEVQDEPKEQMGA